MSKAGRRIPVFEETIESVLGVLCRSRENFCVIPVGDHYELFVKDVSRRRALEILRIAKADRLAV